MSVLFDLSLEVSLVIITAIGMTVFTKQHGIENIKLSR
jgi:hypothetical protein